MNGFTVLQGRMILKVLPENELTMYNVLTRASGTVGIGLGPFFASFICWLFDARSIDEKAAAPMRVLAAFCFMLACLCNTCVPDSLELMSEEHQATQVCASQKSILCTDQDSLSQQKQVWTIAAFFGMERALTVSALEVATALLLETSYGLGVGLIGYLIGGAFLVSAPLAMFLMRFLQNGTVPVWLLLRLLMGFCLL